MIPRLEFAHLPTRIEPLPRLEQVLGGPHLLVKRDDQTGLALGGNKTRKLEFLIAEAQAQGAHTLITAGAVQSNHCRQTAAAAARFGFECRLVLAGERPGEGSGNLLLDQLLGARIVWAGEREKREAVLQATFEHARAEGARPYLIPYGGSNATGALGYAFAMQEFLRQEVAADWIVFASSSGGTQAGLTAGAQAFGYNGRLLGISVDEGQAELQARVAALATETCARLGQNHLFQPEQIRVNADFCAPGYGVLTESERQAMQLFARLEGLLLDPVYTGRAAAGLIQLVRAGFFQKSDTVLFWHTGGEPALFADQYRGL
jgi:D-cysteine desulfhydrase